MQGVHEELNQSWFLCRWES